MEEIIQALSIGIDWIIFATETARETILGMDNSGKLIFCLTIFAYIILIVDIYIYDGVSQSFFTWILWGILDSILFTVSSNEKASDLPIILANIVGSFFTALSLLWVKNVKWTREETRTSIYIFITIFLWIWTKSDLVGLILSVFAEVLAGIPEMRASWKTPGSKLTLISYLIFIICYSLSTIYSKSYRIEDTLFPITFLIYCLVDTYPLVKKWVLARY